MTECGEPLDAYRRPTDCRNVIRLYSAGFTAVLRVIEPRRRCDVRTSFARHVMRHYRKDHTNAR